MAILRQNPGLSCALALLVCSVVATLLVVWPHGAPALAGEPHYDPLDAVTAGQIRVLQHDAGLDDAALACLNLSAEPLEGILGGLRGDFVAHAPDWRAARRAVADQQARVRLLESALDNGVGQSAALQTAREQLVQLQAAYQQRLITLRTSLTAALSANQQTLLAHLCEPAQGAMPYRVLELTAEQQQLLAGAQLRYHQRLALARDAQTQAALAAAFAREREAAIGATNLQTLEALHGYLGEAAQRVVFALNLVFPIG